MGDDGDYAGFRSGPIEDSAESDAVEALRARLAMVPDAIARWVRVARIQPKAGSQLALDDEIGWQGLSDGIYFHLNHAADALNSLTVLIPPTGPLTMPLVAHYAVARSALEAASLALWILAPDDARLRVERHVRNAWREVCAEAEMNKVVITVIEHDPLLGSDAMLDRVRKQNKAWKEKHVAQIRAAAHRIGFDDPTESNHYVGFAEIVREATVATDVRGAVGEIVWRQISGLSHPSIMRSLRAMDHEEIVDHGDGTRSALFTSNAGTAKDAVEAALLAFKTAVAIFGHRKVKPGDPAR